MAAPEFLQVRALTFADEACELHEMSANYEALCKERNASVVDTTWTTAMNIRHWGLSHRIRSPKISYKHRLTMHENSESKAVNDHQVVSSDSSSSPTGYSTKHDSMPKRVSDDAPVHLELMMHQYEYL